MPVPARTGPAKALTVYYAATLLFIALDYLVDVNVRLAFLETAPGFRVLYYVLCLVCLALIIRFPDWSAWIATAESLLALTLLILNMGARIMIVTDEMIESGRGFVSMSEILNFMLASAALYVAYLRGSKAIRDGAPPSL